MIVDNINLLDYFNREIEEDYDIKFEFENSN